jgi:hypothetical protein
VELDGGANSTLTDPFDITATGLAEGNRTLNVYANDTLNHLSIKLYIFEFDTEPPNFILESPTNESVVETGGMIDLNIYDDLSNLHLAWYNWNGGSNSTITDPFQITITGLAEGNNTLNVWANDTMSNENNTLFIFEVDDTAPAIELNSPADVEYIYGQTGFSITWVVTGRDSGSYYNITRNGIDEVTSTLLTNDSITQLLIPYLPIGTHTFTCGVNSSGFGVGVSDIVIVVVLEGTGGPPGDGGPTPPPRDLNVTVIYDESLTDEEKLNVTIFVRYGDRLLLSAMVIIQFDSNRYELVSNGEGAFVWTLDTAEMEGLYAFTVIVNSTYGDYAKDYHFTITRVRIVYPVTISDIAGYMMRSPLSMSITGIFVFCLLIAVATRRKKKKPEDEVREREEKRMQAILGKR